MTERWDRHFLALALAHARMSKDPSTQVGAIIVGPDREVRSSGFNGFPRGIADTAERLNNRDVKYSLVVHGEMNAVLAAARIGVSVKGCALYVACTNSAGVVWGGPPCTRCTVEIIQAGISEIVAHSSAAIPERWRKSTDDARALLAEAGVAYREVGGADEQPEYDLYGAACVDCGLPYSSDRFPDLVLENAAWLAIAPADGLLCPGCINARLERTGRGKIKLPPAVCRALTGELSPETIHDIEEMKRAGTHPLMGLLKPAPAETQAGVELQPGWLMRDARRASARLWQWFGGRA